MTNKAGRTVRKQNPEPVIPKEPPLDVRCLCPKCSNLFSPEEIGGAYLNRLCRPAELLCPKQPMTNGRAPSANRSMRSKRGSFWRRRRPEKWKERRNGKLFVWVAPLKRYADRKLRAIEETLGDIRADKLDSWRDLGALALSRYYTGEWYLRTGFPLERTVIDLSSSFPSTRQQEHGVFPAGYGMCGMTASSRCSRGCREGARRFLAALPGSASAQLVLPARAVEQRGMGSLGSSRPHRGNASGGVRAGSEKPQGGERDGFQAF